MLVVSLFLVNLFAVFKTYNGFKFGVWSLNLIAYLQNKIKTCFNFFLAQYINNLVNSKLLSVTHDLAYINSLNEDTNSIHNMQRSSLITYLTCLYGCILLEKPFFFVLKKGKTLFFCF